MKQFAFLLAIAYAMNFAFTSAFQVSCLSRSTVAAPSRRLVSMKEGKNEEPSPGWNPLKDVTDMFSNMDDVIDDFMSKRMGNGEVFYGKRKYKPSGKTDGKHNGMGLTDKRRIDGARSYRESYLEKLRRREEESSP